ncbi:nucleotide pyrophosphohydrolase [Amphibacillus sp. MSJ-3]|uniref:nucleotide pyrophosphohydrolase n=1 Tax=Amphibacillus sp. MSJ-3 TaxID=2841505 RepID=UPI001C0F39C2|nr:nucleotide pyrophosphohydrolase [Amphibacillus sp. MSJ-3]MBU5594220.1 nucleotide pyrophosphohydrolase [Amphibacillus sp. MSJ-3]
MSKVKHNDVRMMQARVDKYISQFEEGYFSPLSMIARFSEEVGELAREVNHYYGEKPKKDSEEENTIENELGDLFFVMLTFANSLNIDLAQAFDQSMTKIETRDKNRWTKIETERER